MAKRKKKRRARVVVAAQAAQQQKGAAVQQQQRQPEADYALEADYTRDGREYLLSLRIRQQSTKEYRGGQVEIRYEDAGVKVCKINADGTPDSEESGRALRIPLRERDRTVKFSVRHVVEDGQQKSLAVRTPTLILKGVRVYDFELRVHWVRDGNEYVVRPRIMNKVNNRRYPGLIEIRYEDAGYKLCKIKADGSAFSEDSEGNLRIPVRERVRTVNLQIGYVVDVDEANRELHIEVPAFQLQLPAIPKPAPPPDFTKDRYVLQARLNVLPNQSFEVVLRLQNQRTKEYHSCTVECTVQGRRREVVGVLEVGEKIVIDPDPDNLEQIVTYNVTSVGDKEGQALSPTPEVQTPTTVLKPRGQTRDLKKDPEFCLEEQHNWIGTCWKLRLLVRRASTGATCQAKVEIHMSGRDAPVKSCVSRNGTMVSLPEEFRSGEVVFVVPCIADQDQPRVTTPKLKLEDPSAKKTEQWSVRCQEVENTATLCRVRFWIEDSAGAKKAGRIRLSVTGRDATEYDLPSEGRTVDIPYLGDKKLDWKTQIINP